MKSDCLSKQNEAWFSNDRTAQASADLLVQPKGSLRSSHGSWEFQQAEMRSFTQGAIFKLDLVQILMLLRGMPLAPGKVMTNISRGWERIVRAKVSG